MKRLKYAVILMLGLSMASNLASCNKEETPSTPQQPSIVGTKWTTTYADYVMVLEFTSNNEVIGYFANTGGAITGSVFNGTYSKTNNSITFSNLRYRWIYAYYELQTGTINGSILSTKGRETFDINSGNWYEWNENWNKQ